MATKKEEDKVTKWIKYLESKDLVEDHEIEDIRKDIADIKKKQDILAKSVLKLYEKMKK